jgi:hypothetical protein
MADYGEKTGRDLHGEILKRADDASQADWQNRLDALEDLRFRANEGGNGQWDPEVLAERVEQGRPVITINLIPQFVRQVTNEARNNRPGIQVRPVDDDADPETAEVYEGIVRHIEDQSEAVSKAYIPAVDGSATCGIGHFRITTDYRDDDSWEQDIFIKGINNPLAVLWDPAAKDPTRMDARYCFVLEDMPKEEYEEKWPDAAVADFNSPNQGQAFQWRINDMVRVAEYWCKEPVTKTLAKTQDGSVLDITNVPTAALKFLPPHKTRKVETHKICQYIVSGTEILEGPNEWAGHYLPIIPVIGEETYVGENRVRSGLVRHAKDPQRLYNLWRSNQADIIGSQPLSPFVATFKQIEKYLPIWRNANKRKTPYLPFDADPQHPGVPQRSQPPVASPGMSEEIAMAANEMRSTTGIYASGLGEHTPDAKSGRAINALQKQGDKSTLHFEDNLQLSIRHCGRVLVDLIPSYYDTERTVRLLNEDGTNRFEKINSLVMTQDGPMPIHDLSVGTYDVTVTTGPSYATRRMEAADAMMQFIQTVPDSAQFMIDIIAKNMDWPGADEIAKRARMMLLQAHPEFADPKDQEQPPPPSPAAQMNALMGQLKIQQEKANTRLLEAQADDAEMDATVKAIQVDAVSQTHHMQVESVILKELIDVITRGQQAMQPAQPGQGAGNQPAPVTPQPAAPAGAQ